MAGTQIASLYAKIGADVSDFQRGMNQAKSELGVLERGMGQLTNVVTGVAKGVAVAGVGVVGAVVAMGTSFNQMKQQAEIAFTTMLGSGTEAKRFLDDLQDFAAKTPFEFPELVTASQRLLAMGFAATEVRPTLTAIGDAVAALGGSSEMINRVTLALGQMQAKGKVSAEEMLQLTEAGIPAWDILANAIGVDIPEAMKMATKGAISADVAIGALVEGMNARFGGLMDQQSRTFGGMISTLKDTAMQAAGTVMAPAFAAMTEGLAALVKFTNQPEFTAGVKALAEIMGTLTSHVMNFARTTLPAMISKVREMVTQVQAWWQSTEQIRVALAAAMEGVGFGTGVIQKMIGAVVNWRDVLTALGIMIAATVIPIIASMVAALWPFIATLAVVTAAVAAARWAWTNNFMGVRDTVQSIITKMMAFWKEWGWYIMNQITFVTKGMDGEFKFKMPLIVGHLQYLFMQGLAKIGGFFHQLKEGAIQKLRELLTWWSGLWNDMKHFYAVNFEEPFSRWWNVLVNVTIPGWVKKWQLWVRDLTEMWEDFIDDWFGWFKPREWWDAGADIIQGFWDGIQTRWRGFWDWIQSRWNDLKNGFKKFFGISSPSKVFKEYGSALTEGLAVGMNMALPQVNAAVGNMQGAATGDGDLASAIRALVAVLQQRGGNNINVTMPQGTGNTQSDLAATVQYLQALYA